MNRTSSSSASADEEHQRAGAIVSAQQESLIENSNIPQANAETTQGWNDWKWQLRNRIRSVEQLAKYLNLSGEVSNLSAVAERYPLAITPYYANLIRRPDLSDPIFQMAVPQCQELFSPAFLDDDPLEEHQDMPVPGLIHRYCDRALLIATTTCGSYCRHCTRKRIAGMRESTISATRLRQVAEYLSNHPEISDVIVSGGDPLTMATAALEKILETLRSIKSISVIRIGTRVPVVLPMRITDELVNMLKKYHPVWINTHFNHPNEITDESISACTKLADTGIPMGNQSVLLRNVNDKPFIIEQLCRRLISIRVRPYYLYQCDLVRGVEHFRTPLSKGIEIMEYLRGRLSGIAIPNFVVDAPHGAGKIPVTPNYIISMSPTHTVLRNYEGLLVNYPEPGAAYEPCSDKDDRTAGVWELATGKASLLAHDSIARIKRRRKSTVKKITPSISTDKKSVLLTDENGLLHCRTKGAAGC
ncbi:MAG: KamA family radical SAM protein [Sedimentisphaerales bacterium]|nr:KamA family radical SAM protein [Sedimentisphaerales bacterium]